MNEELDEFVEESSKEYTPPKPIMFVLYRDIHAIKVLEEDELPIGAIWVGGRTTDGIQEWWSPEYFDKYEKTLTEKGL